MVAQANGCCGMVSRYMLLSCTSQFYRKSRTLETVHTAFMLRQIYYYTIISFGDFEGIARIDW